jgi:hypothetical protein
MRKRGGVSFFSLRKQRRIYTPRLFIHRELGVGEWGMEKRWLIN